MWLLCKLHSSHCTVSHSAQCHGQSRCQTSCCNRYRKYMSVTALNFCNDSNNLFQCCTVHVTRRLQQLVSHRRCKPSYMKNCTVYNKALINTLVLLKSVTNQKRIIWNYVRKYGIYLWVLSSTSGTSNWTQEDGKIRKYLGKDDTERLIHAFVTRLDYCNSIIYGISARNQSKLQRLQNTAARVVTRAKSPGHNTNPEAASLAPNWTADKIQNSTLNI